MKSVMRTIARIVNGNKRNWTALKPKGMELDYNDSPLIVENKQMVPGLQMASKVSIIICDMELRFARYAPENIIVRASDLGMLSLNRIGLASKIAKQMQII